MDGDEVMALETRLKAFLSGQSKDVFLKKKGTRDPILVKASSGSATIFLTALITFAGETAGTPEVDLAVTGEKVDGIIVGKAWDATDLSKDSDSPYADGVYLFMEEIEIGDEFYVTAKTNTAIDYKERVMADGGFGAPYAYTDASEITDTLQSVIGTAMEAVTATASTEKLFLVKGGVA